MVITVTFSTLGIATLKQLVSMDCPWDLVRYGGDLPFIGLFEARPKKLPDSACFPAGHASPGYAWSKATQRRATIDSSCLRSDAYRPHSHANLFHSVLGLMGVTTQVYRPEFDIFSHCR